MNADTSWRFANSQELATLQLTKRLAHGEIPFVRERATATGKRLVATRLALGFERPGDFAKELSVDKGDYSKYEAGKKRVPQSLAFKLKEKYNISLDWTLWGDPMNLSPEFYSKISKARPAA
jgi:hypothetical protein